MKRLAIAVLLLAACDRPSPPAPAPAPPAPPSPPPARVVQLDEPTLERFLRSMKPPAPAVAFLFLDLDSAAGARKIADIEASDAHAQAFGFRDFSEYVMIWGRIARGRIAVLSEEFDRKSLELLESHIRTSEKELNRPDLPEDLRKEHQQLVADTRKAIAELKAKPAPSNVPPEDLALVRTHFQRVQAAWEEIRK